MASEIHPSLNLRVGARVQEAQLAASDLNRTRIRQGVIVAFDPVRRPGQIAVAVGVGHGVELIADDIGLDGGSLTERERQLRALRDAEVRRTHERAGPAEARPAVGQHLGESACGSVTFAVFSPGRVPKQVPVLIRVGPGRERVEVVFNDVRARRIRRERHAAGHENSAGRNRVGDDHVRVHPGADIGRDNRVRNRITERNRVRGAGALGNHQRRDINLHLGGIVGRIGIGQVGGVHRRHRNARFILAVSLKWELRKPDVHVRLGVIQ